MSNSIPYVIISKSCGKFYSRGLLSDYLKNNINLNAYLDKGFIISLFNVHNLDYENLINDLPYGHHPSFAFNNLNIELCVGDYV